jgi:hypothetical protein
VRVGEEEEGEVEEGEEELGGGRERRRKSRGGRERDTVVEIERQVTIEQHSATMTCDALSGI